MDSFNNFYLAVKNDHRICTTHISLYMALYHFYILNSFTNPVPITRRTLMDLAKINGLATYHKCIRELHDFGYIQYTPSYNPATNSHVQLLNL